MITVTQNTSQRTHIHLNRLFWGNATTIKKTQKTNPTKKQTNKQTTPNPKNPHQTPKSSQDAKNHTTLHATPTSAMKLL